MQNQLVKDSRNLVLTDTNPACAPPPHLVTPTCPSVSPPGTYRACKYVNRSLLRVLGWILDLEKLNFKSSPFFNQFSFQTVIKPDILINLDQLTFIHFLHTKQNTLEIKEIKLKSGGYRRCLGTF